MKRIWEDRESTTFESLISLKFLNKSILLNLGIFGMLILFSVQKYLAIVTAEVLPPSRDRKTNSALIKYFSIQDISSKVELDKRMRIPTYLATTRCYNFYGPRWFCSLWELVHMLSDLARGFFKSKYKNLWNIYLHEIFYQQIMSTELKKSLSTLYMVFN